MRRRLRVRWRLTLWYAALLAVAMLLFAGGLYLVLKQRLYAGFDEQLLNQATLTLASVRIRDGLPTMAPPTTSQADGEYFLRLLSADGRTVLAVRGNPSNIPLDAEVATAAAAGLTQFSAAADEDGDTLRIATVPVRRSGAGGAVVGLLQVGLDRNEIDEPLHDFLQAFAVVGPLSLLLATGGGYLLASRALAPVASMTRLAAGINAGDLQARLGLDLPNDELGTLARTFDAMLGRIEDAFERQRRFTGDAAHELRTPLSLMRSQVDLALARPRAAEDYREALRGLDDDLQRLTDLVAALLTLARADSGTLIPDVLPFDLAITIALTLEQYASAAAAAHIDLRDETRPTPLVADEDLLVQVLVNLIDNALRHTAPGGTISAGCRGEHRQARLWIVDTGSGIAPEHQRRVFDRFYRIDAARGRNHGGTGLGLAISREIAEAHGGTIVLTSALGGGTRVELTLPTTD